MKPFHARPLTISISALLFSAACAFADPATLQTTVKGPDGRAAKGADLRIERQDKKATPVVAKTDANGRYDANGLDAGTYRLTAKLASGAQSVQVVKVQSGKPLAVTFDMKTPTAAPAGPKKVARWVPSSTGSHMGGHYEGEEARGPKGPVENVSASAVQRPLTQSSVPRGN
jgi:hypothetical protein